ncbi:MAG: hypothetical protein V4751_06205 [Pseudomonadota bacterium]
MIVTRTTWQGEGLYTCQITGQTRHLPEDIVMIQAFDDTGIRQPYFKIQYFNERGEPALKMAFRNRVDTDVPDTLQTECFDIDSTFELPRNGDTAVGALDVAYANTAKGKLRGWTLVESQLFQTWHYMGFWGHMVPNMFPASPPDFRPLFINGHGHSADGRFVRTMSYSAGEGTAAEVRFLRSSVLNRVKVETSATGYVRFR